jgi:hypothetical protein
MRSLLLGLTVLASLLPLLPTPTPAEEPNSAIKVTQTDEYVQIDTSALQARIRKKGYVSGVAAGTLLDKMTGAHDVGFGLHIMDFLMAPGWKDDGYPRDAVLHGNLPKHYIEGPQICTQAKQLQPEVIEGKDFVAVRLSFKFTKPAEGFKAGSLWEQTLVFLPNTRYFLSGEQITSVNEVDDLFYRIDMPGHIRHRNGDTFSQVYLSYHEKPIPAEEFSTEFAPDGKYLYQRKDGMAPKYMIRSYKLKVDGKPGPWVGGLTLDPAAVSEAWCHQRGYVCFIQELHRHKVKAGETFGAAYAVGYFDNIAEMEKVCDQYRGKRKLTVKDRMFVLE